MADVLVNGGKLGRCRSVGIPMPLGSCLRLVCAVPGILGVLDGGQLGRCRAWGRRGTIRGRDIGARQARETPSRVEGCLDQGGESDHTAVEHDEGSLALHDGIAPSTYLLVSRLSFPSEGF